MAEIIKVQNLTKKYPSLTAVDGISFDVSRGEIFGLLGENGAGKTTTLEMIEGLRQPTSGKISVLGHDATADLNSIKEKIGVQLQSSAYFNFLTLREILDLFGSFYHKSLAPDELLSMVGLEEKADTYVNKLSGGQKQRFSIVASLVNDPEIVFLDEPTTGLDPLARRHLWELITDIKNKGKTVILTTHYMEEAEILCDRIAIMDQGKILTIGETHKLIEETKLPFKIEFIILKLPQNIKKKLENLGELVNVGGKFGNFELKLKTQANLNTALGYIHEQNPESLTVGRARLEDLFIELTGRNIKEEEDV